MHVVHTIDYRILDWYVTVSSRIIPVYVWAILRLFKKMFLKLALPRQYNQWDCGIGHFFKFCSLSKREFSKIAAVFHVFEENI
jgi:hypothetical protein